MKQTVVIGLILAFVVFWWIPNFQEWVSCGMSTGAAAYRGVSGKPNTLECLGSAVQVPVPSEPTPAESSPSDTATPNNPPDRPDCFWQSATDVRQGWFAEPLDGPDGPHLPCKSRYLNPDGSIPQ